MSLLYVEDDPGSRKVMQHLVTRLETPVNLTMFEDSTDFLPRVEQMVYSPHVFLIDIHVTPLDGFAMLEQLRARPRFASKMIVALTASVMSSEIQQLRKAGFDGVLAKPLSFHTFPAMLERVFVGEHIWTVSR
ncbi:MAG: response regulator [Chloroflexota bacterium]